MTKENIPFLTKSQFDELCFTEKQLSVPQLSKRIQCIKLKNEWWIHQKIADFLWITTETVRVRIYNYTIWWLSSLLHWNYIGKLSLLSLEQLRQLKKIHKSHPFSTAAECQQYIQKTYAVEYHLHRVQKLLKNDFNVHTKK